MIKRMTVMEEHYLLICKAFKKDNLSEIKEYLFQKMNPIKDKEFIETHSRIIDKVFVLR